VARNTSSGHIFPNLSRGKRHLLSQRATSLSNGAEPMTSGLRWPIKRTLLGAIIISTFTLASVAQHGGGAAGGGHIGAAAPVARANPGRPNGAYPTRPTYGFDGLGYRNRYWGGYRGLGYGTYGLGWGYPGSFSDIGWPMDYGAPDEMGASAPSVVIMMPQPPPEPPPPPAELVIHEYKWPNTNSVSRTPFFIATKDGRILRAIAVTTQGNAVSLITPNNTATRIPLAQIARDLTHKLNEENKLTLWLPPSIEH